MAAYTSLIELYVQFLVYIEYQVLIRHSMKKNEETEEEPSFIVSQIQQSFFLDSTFNLVHHCQHVYCVARTTMAQENMKKLLD